MHPDHLDDLIRRSDEHVGGEPDDNRPDAVRDVQGRYPMHCPECGRYGNEEDGCEAGGDCPDEDCCGTIVAAHPIVRLPADSTVTVEVDNRTFLFADLADAVRTANAILSEVETILRDGA